MKGKVLSAVVEHSRSLRKEKTEVLNLKKKIHCVTENYIHVECESEIDIQPGTLIQIKIIQVLEEFIRDGKEIEAKGTLI